MLPQSYEARIERVEGVDNAAHSTWFGGIYQKPKNFFAQIPVEPEQYLDMYPEFVCQTMRASCLAGNPQRCIGGGGTWERFGWKLGDRIPINATIWVKKDGGQTWEFDIVAVYDGAEKEHRYQPVFLPL